MTLRLDGHGASRAADCDPADLVALIRAGDPEAESQLVQRYSRGLTAILRRAAADRTVAEDLHQETFRIALVKIRQGDLRDPSRLAGFLSSSLGTSLSTTFAGARRALRRQPARPWETCQAPTADHSSAS